MEKLREFRILKEIPGISNAVDTFVKEERVSFNWKKKKTATLYATIVLSQIEVRGMNEEIKESERFKVLAHKEVIVEHDTIKLLIEHGYIEEYVDNFAH